MELKEVVELFKKVGAKCRKVRGKNEYNCWLGGVVADIREGLEGPVVTLRLEGEFRFEYSDWRTEEGYEDRDLLRELKELTGADSVDMRLPCDVILELEFRGWDKARLAAEALKKLAENHLDFALTNMRGELRLYMNGRSVSADEWLSVFER